MGAFLFQLKHKFWGQVDGMLKELDRPPEWLLREVGQLVMRLAAVTQEGMG